jgi:hypothetical protein
MEMSLVSTSIVNLMVGLRLLRSLMIKNRTLYGENHYKRWEDFARGKEKSVEF